MIDDKRLELIELLDSLRLIDVPAGISTKARNLLVQAGVNPSSTVEILRALQGKSLWRIPGMGEVYMREACWLAIYGNEGGDDR